MKKYFGIMAAIMFMATLSFSSVYAQQNGKGKMNGNNVNRGTRFIDANGDGICDNNASGKVSAGMRNQGKVKPNFVDANGDGICDNNATGTMGAGKGNRGKTKPNFIDADGDGVCDNFANRNKTTLPVK
jgi:hypothetical protein